MMTIRHITVQQAHQQQTSGATYLDVRSVPEFEHGHPAGAFNVPLLHVDPQTGQMRPNPEFLTVVKANFPLTRPWSSGARWADGRSRRARSSRARASRTSRTCSAAGA